LKMLDGGLDDERDIGDAAAAGGDGDGLAGLHFLAKIELRELGGDRGGDLINR